MFSFISGKVLSRQGNELSVLCDSLGFLVAVPARVTCVLNENISLYIHMHWNQEHGPSLYGFEDQQEKTLFMLLLSCSGVGPKMALEALSTFSASSLVHALATGDAQQLCAISGVGKKKAEQLIVHLRDKAQKLLESGEFAVVGKGADMQKIMQVLKSLGYAQIEIDRAVQYVGALDDPFDVLVKKALIFLAKK